MYGPGRGRTLSLVHIPSTGLDTTDAAGGPTTPGDPTGSHHSGGPPQPTGGRLIPTSSEPDLRLRQDDDVEHGIDLLVAGSPIDHSAVADDTLLDYDSKEETVRNTIVLSSDNATSAMDV